MILSEKVLFPTTNRLLPLDVIRGFAVLGMIFINILVFIPNFYEILFDETVNGKNSLEGTIFKIIYIFFDGKMRALFALLFGAGIIFFFQSNTIESTNKSDYFSRRMFWLLLFGLIHAYLLLWPGSILFEYALCGLLLFTLRGLHSKTLFILSFAILGFYVYINSNDYSKTYATYKGYEKAVQLEKANQTVPENLIKSKEKFDQYLENFPPFSQAKTEEIETEKQTKIKLYSSGLISIFGQNINRASESLSLGVYLDILESIGTMLLGMALLKLGFFEFKFKKQLYYTLSIAGIFSGIFLYFLLHSWRVATKMELIYLYSWKSFSSTLVEGFGRIVFSLGYCSLLILMCQYRFLNPVLALIGNVGRMAFSNYITQTVICVLFFYVFKYYGNINMIGITVLSMCIIVFQLVTSYLCITFFNSGPLEYLWRKLSKYNLP